MSPAPRAYKVGYARVSSPHQKLDAQFDALQQAGCNKIWWCSQCGDTSLSEAHKLLFYRREETLLAPSSPLLEHYRTFIVQ